MSRRRASGGVDRRGLLKRSGGALLSLGLLHLIFHARAIYGAPGHGPRAQAIEIAKV